MKDFLIYCYYDGYTLEEAIAFAERCYANTPTAKQIKAAREAIKHCTGIDW